MLKIMLDRIKFIIYLMFRLKKLTVLLRTKLAKTFFSIIFPSQCIRLSLSEDQNLHLVHFIISERLAPINSSFRRSHR